MAAHPVTLAENDRPRNDSPLRGKARLQHPPMNIPAVADSYDTRPWRTSALVALAMLLVAHVALIVWGVSRLLPESPYNAVDVVKLRQVVTSAALVLGALVLLDKRRPALA